MVAGSEIDVAANFAAIDDGAVATPKLVQSRDACVIAGTGIGKARGRPPQSVAVDNLDRCRAVTCCRDRPFVRDDGIAYKELVRVAFVFLIGAVMGIDGHAAGTRSGNDASFFIVDGKEGATRENTSSQFSVGGDDTAIIIFDGEGLVLFLLNPNGSAIGQVDSVNLQGACRVVRERDRTPGDAECARVLDRNLTRIAEDADGRQLSDAIMDCAYLAVVDDRPLGVVDVCRGDTKDAEVISVRRSGNICDLRGYRGVVFKRGAVGL